MANSERYIRELLHGRNGECYRPGCREKATHRVVFAEGFEQVYCTKHFVDYATWPGATCSPCGVLEET